MVITNENVQKQNISVSKFMTKRNRAVTNLRCCGIYRVVDGVENSTDDVRIDE